MRKKGFTLIELLAVIVILAIIALIAVPIVINIIQETRVSSQERSVELFVDQVEKTIAKENLKRSYNPNYCEIQNNGKIVCYGPNGVVLTTDEEDNALNVDMKGESPTEGIIIIGENNKLDYNFVLGGKNYTNNDNKTETAICKLDKETSSKLSISPGTKYECEVKEGTKYNFYVLSFEKGIISLIMDNNVCNDGTLATSQNNCQYAWHDIGDADPETYTTNEFGPDTLMNELYSATSDWNNVQNINFTYDDFKENRDLGRTCGNYGYGGLEINEGVLKIITKNGNILEFNNKIFKSRIPIESEIRKALTFTNHNSSWMNPIHTFWTMTSDICGFPLATEIVDYYNTNNSLGYSSLYSNEREGMRPVINVRLSDLSS